MVKYMLVHAKLRNVCVCFLTNVENFMLFYLYIYKRSIKGVHDLDFKSKNYTEPNLFYDFSLILPFAMN